MSVLELTTSNRSAPKEWFYFRPTFGDFIAALGVFVIRLPVLRRALRSVVPGGEVARDKYLEKFLEAYLLLPCFIRILSDVKPHLVVMSNDHSTANRSLLSVAQAKGIKTAYLQHASASELLPSLEFDYAFLDGRASLAVYANCEEAETVSSGTHVYLSGQKKRVTANCTRGDQFRVGLAVNNLDELDRVRCLIERFTAKSAAITVRLHPAQWQGFAEPLVEEYRLKQNVEIISAKDEPLIDFFGRCHIVVAGASSILLEAALAGVAPYHAQMSSHDVEDYYGYVRSGLARPLPDDLDAMSNDCLFALAHMDQSVERAARWYSESFGTKWQGREGDLVAETILRLMGKCPVSDIYTASEERLGFRSLFFLIEKDGVDINLEVSGGFAEGD